MALIGRLHPMVIHFPIALLLVAAACEGASMLTREGRWRAAAVVNARTGAVFALAAAYAGWRLASAPGIESTPMLEWHRWLGVATATAAFVASTATWRMAHGSSGALWLYRIGLFAAAASVGATGHLGGLLVWGADFLRP
jgi:uncharacterized membrane protein